MNYNKALQIASEIKKKIRGLIITGSLTRGHDIINDIDFLTFRDLDDVVNDFKKKIASVNIEQKGTKRAILNVGNYFKINIWYVPNKSLLPFFKLEYDSGKANIKYKTIAKRHGLTLSTKGLYHGNVYLNSNFNTKNKIIKYLKKLEEESS